MLTLSDLDNFTLDELDDFTLGDLDNMSYAQLLTAVQAKYQIANKQCDKNTPLSSEQVQAVTEIVHTYMKESEKHSLAKELTEGVAINVIGTFLCFLANTAIEHAPEITKALKQALVLLYQFIKQTQT